MGPMAMGQLDDHWAYKQESIDHFTERARGGTGLIITGANFIENRIEKHRKASFPCPLEDPQSYMTQLKKMSDNIHAYNSKLFVQLTAGLGRSAIPAMILDNTFVAPSATTNRWDPSIQHRALTTEEIYELIKDFATCAMLAKMGGADGIEVHAGHEGYLLDNFTMEYFNQREDEFGGDLMGRLRFPLAILQAVKQACGKDFPVILRFSLKSFIRAERHGILPGESYPELGRDIEEGLQFAKILTEAGYDALNVDAGSYDAWYWAHPPFFQDRGLYLPFAEKVKKVVKVPVLTAGRMGYPQLAADALQEGKCDMVVLGRPLLADPEFVNKMRQGNIQDIRPCQGTTMKEVKRAIEDLRSKLLASRQRLNRPLIDLNYKIDAEYFKLSLVSGEKEQFLANSRLGCMQIICPPNADFTDEKLQSWLRKVIEESLRRNAKSILPPRLDRLSKQCGLPYASVKINSSQGRWGSCSTKKDINLSYYLVLLPSYLIDYVLLHELCHTREMNHSERFWSLLNQFTEGKALALRGELKKYRTEI